MEKIETHRIKIEVVTKEYIKKTKTCYFDKKTGEEISWNTWYKIDDDVERDAKYAKHEVETGETEVNERTEKVYEQEKQGLDIGELAMFINRNR